MGLEQLRLGETVILVAEDLSRVEVEVLESYGWRGLVRGVAVCRVARLVAAEDAELAVTPYLLRRDNPATKRHAGNLETRGEVRPDPDVQAEADAAPVAKRGHARGVRSEK